MVHSRAFPRRVLIGLLAGSIVLTGCGGQQDSTESAAAERLIVGASLEPPTLDPTINDAASIPQILLYNVYETLIKVDDAGEIQPLLATEWDVSDDGLVYTFELEPDATFASGNPVTATDAVWSIERIQNDPMITPVRQTQMSVVESAVAVDEHTLEVTLSRPSNAWLFEMSQTAGIIFDSAAEVDLATATAGSGPYMLGEWRPGDSITLVANPTYWGDAANFAEVQFRYFVDATAMNNAMLSGDLDIISNVQAPQAISQFEDPARFTIIEGTTSGEVTLGFNNAVAPLDNLLVRQAIMYAIDRQALMDTVWNGKGMLIGSMVPPTDPWYEDLSQLYPYDPNKARELLEEAGMGPISLRLRLPNIAYATSSGQFIQSQLREVGIETVIDELEFPTWIEQVLVNGDYDMTIVAHVEMRDIGKFADPTYYWHYDNSTFQELVAQADTGTPEEQIEYLTEAARLLAEDAAANWLFLLPNLIVTKANISGVPENATSLSFDLTGVAAG